MGYYSIIAVARRPVAIESPAVLLDTGRNVITVQTNDLTALLRTFLKEDVIVRQVNQLDDFEPVDPKESLGLPDDPSPRIAPTDEAEES